LGMDSYRTVRVMNEGEAVPAIAVPALPDVGGMLWPPAVDRLMVIGVSRRKPGHSRKGRFYGRSMPQKKGSHVQPLPLPSVTSKEISSQSTSNPSRYTLTRIVYVPAKVIFSGTSQ